MTYTIPRHTIRRVMSPEAAGELVGTMVPAKDATDALNHEGLWLDEATGEPILGIFRCPELPALRKAVLSAEPAMSGPDASGGGAMRSGSGNRNNSVTFGYRPRKPMMRQEACVLTAFNRDFPTIAAFLAHYAEVLAQMVADTMPEIEVMGREQIAKVLPDWRLSKNSLWTSGVINKESSLPYHRDGNNFDAWSVMPVIRQGVTGGFLDLPEYGVTIPARDGYAYAFYGKRLVHGVTPMVKKRADSYRVSIVYYALQGLKDCHTFAEETATARKRRTDREERMADPEHKFEKVISGKRGSGVPRVNKAIRQDEIEERS
jgi:hypothetical protein